MARPRGGDSVARKKGGAKGRTNRARQVYIFTEGEVTEPQYIDIIMEKGTPATAGRSVDHHYKNENAAGKHRKPYAMVKDAVRTLRKVEREARDAGLKTGDWNYPQVWVLFDRDGHLNIREAKQLADKEGVKVAYSHPCFELWRLLHYTNYTSSFGGVCDDANSRLRSRPGFAATYGRQVRAVSKQQAKHMREEQVLSKDGQRYADAKKYAMAINNRVEATNPEKWDPYTDVWNFVEEGLLLSGY
ncbi:RloB family protein [Streptomyces sp. CB01580]|uniref:RloB family protein n=1 Tax=Streptomyces sp. CB01580 TaxID=1703933 RepID=UPI000939AD1F|nr:RloB family protein [Streptomyces sp. CB01580]